MCWRAIAIPWEWIWWRTSILGLLQRQRWPEEGTLAPGFTYSPIKPFVGCSIPPCTLCHSFPSQHPDVISYHWTFSDYLWHRPCSSPSPKTYQLCSHGTWYETLLYDLLFGMYSLPCFCPQCCERSCSMDGSFLYPRTVSQSTAWILGKASITFMSLVSLRSARPSTRNSKGSFLSKLLRPIWVLWSKS